MTFGNKLAGLRRENNITQEQLAAALGVSRQSVSKWESGSAYPETEKLLRMCDLFNCTLDYLVRDAENAPASPPECRSLIRERRSRRELMGMPLWHIGKRARGFIAVGFDAEGVIAVGLYARGIASVGLLSIGVIGFGVLGIGLLGLGVIALGLLAFGSFSLGIIAGGAICCGVFSMGAIALGDFSVGALAIGKYAASGDTARADIAIGMSEATGKAFSLVGSRLSAADKAHVELLLRSVPGYLRWAAALFLKFI